MSRSPHVSLSHGLVTPDGATLATDVYLPHGDGAFPVVLIRTPYDRFSHLEEALGWVQAGFGCVVQDVRGRYGSTGDWQPYCNEHNDGRLTMDWLAVQPWCDGRVASAGAAYAAFAAWQTAASGHPAMRSLLSLTPSMSIRDRRFGAGNVLQLEREVWWQLTYGGRTSREGLFDAVLGVSPDALNHLPLSGIGTAVWEREIDVLQPVDSPPACEIRADLPSFHLSGWYDPYVQTTLDHWAEAERRSGDAARALIIGPWTHPHNLRLQAVCDLDFGPDADLPLAERQAQWLRAVLDGDRPRTVQLFLLGANRWVSAEAWPPVATRTHALFLGAGGRLTLQPDETSGCEGFSYDPADPFPSGFHSTDQSKLTPRDDAVRYTTGVLDRDLVWFGNATVELYVTSEAPTSDWAVRLLHCLPDGRRFVLGAGIGTVDSRGEGPHRCPVNLPPAAVAIPAGHRLQVEVAGSYFPAYARNLNTGADRYTTSAMTAARQQVFHGAAYPSCLSLPCAQGAI